MCQLVCLIKPLAPNTQNLVVVVGFLKHSSVEMTSEIEASSYWMGTKYFSAIISHF